MSSSARVDYGAAAGFGVVQTAEVPQGIAQGPTTNLPGARGESSNDPNIPTPKTDTPLEPATADTTDPLFKLSGVDFVSEGGFAFALTEEGPWKAGVKAEDLPLLNESPEKPDHERLENETGDGLQQGPEGQSPAPAPEKMEVNEVDPDKPLVRKQFKNFKLNEKILGRISSERSSLNEKEECAEEPTPEALPQGTNNHLLFNGARAGRFYTLTFSRDEDSDVLQEASDDVQLNRFRHVNCYALNTTAPIEIPSIYDDTDVDMPLTLPPTLAQFRNNTAEDTRMHSTTGIPEDTPGNLKIYKTHSNLTMDKPLKPCAPSIINACGVSTANTPSCNTLDTDIQAEDEIKTVEPLPSAACISSHAMTSSMPASMRSMASIRGMDLEPTAVIVIGDLNRGGNWGSSEMDEQMPSEVALGAGSMARDRRRDLYSTLTPDRRRYPRKLDSRGDENWRGRRHGADSWDDEESLSLDISRKNSFVSIDLDYVSSSRENEDPSRYNSARTPETIKGPKGLSDSKRTQSRLLKMKRKLRNICEKVKKEIVKKK